MLAKPLFFHLARPGPQQAGAIEIAEHLLRIFAADDWQPADIVLQHAVHRIVREFIRIRDDRRMRACIENRHRSLRVLLQRA